MRDEVYKRRDDFQNCWYKDCCDTNLCGDCNGPCRRFVQTDYLFQLSNLPQAQWRVNPMDESYLTDETLEILNTIKADIKYFVQSGRSLYLYGLPGTGKTSWAIRLMSSYFAEVAETTAFTTRGLYVSVPSFLCQAKLNIAYKLNSFRELLKEIETCDVVVWDEIEQTNPTNYESQLLYAYINGRLLAGKSNIFTSNKNPDELKVSDPAMASRICSASDCIEITGPDMRYKQKYTYFMMNREEIENGSDTSNKQDSENI